MPLVSSQVRAGDAQGTDRSVHPDGPTDFEAFAAGDRGVRPLRWQSDKQRQRTGDGARARPVFNGSFWEEARGTHKSSTFARESYV
jgi:hypothetical protein